MGKSRFRALLIRPCIFLGRRIQHVGIAIAYDTFFAEQIQKEIISIPNSDLNFFSTFILEFSKDMPFFYGLFSIMFAILLGVAAAFIRRFVSNFKKKMLLKS